MGGDNGEAPVGAVHVQDVALVVHELHLHALNVDGSEIHALVGLQGGAELNVGLTGRHGERFDGYERQHVGGGGSRVPVHGGAAAVLVDGVDGVQLRLRELTGRGLHVRGVARRVAVHRNARVEIRRQAEPRVAGGNVDQPFVQVVLVVVVQHDDNVLGPVRVGHRFRHDCIGRSRRSGLQPIHQLVRHGRRRRLVGSTKPHEPAQVGIHLGCGNGVIYVGRDERRRNRHLVGRVKKQEVVRNRSRIGDRHFAVVDIVRNLERGPVERCDACHVRLQL